MVISMKNLKKPVAWLLAAAVLFGCAFSGVKLLKKQFYPRSYSEYVEKYCAVYDINPNLAYAVIHTESGFDSNAVSHLGACGLMQLMPETFDWLRAKDKKNGSQYSDIFDPETNIRYGVYFLSIIQHRFSSERSAIAAYHAHTLHVCSGLNGLQGIAAYVAVTHDCYFDLAHFIMIL